MIIKMRYELLDPNKICCFIEPENLSSLSVLDILPTVDSTNSYLMTQAKQGARSGAVCLAEQQTKGRGRLGRTWFSPYGTNIYCSLLWRFAMPLQNMSSLSMVVAVIVANVLQTYGIDHAIQLKWPNDVLILHRKLAGILLECDSHSGVVIGIGLNLNIQAADEKHWIDLAELTGQPIERNRLTGLLLNELLAKLPLYATHGLQKFLSDWQKHDVLANKAVTVHTPEQDIQGIVQGISETGELLLLNKSGTLQRFCYGEVSVRYG